MLRALALLLMCVSTLLAQGRVPKEFQHERILVIVSMIGRGSFDDPIRPQFAPKPGQKSPFLSVHYDLSDDGKSALVEFVAKDRSAFKDILAAKGNSVKVFEPNKNTQADVEREFSKVKTGYTFAIPGKSDNGNGKKSDKEAK